MNIIKQYTRAANSSDLRNDETHHQPEVLAAVALGSTLGSLLFRAKYCGDQSSIPPLYAIWREMVLKKATRRKWVKDAESVADISLMHWLDDICHQCHGRGHPVIKDTPTLEASACTACNGTGRKKLHCDASIKEYVLDSVQSLESMVSEASYKARMKI